jgi:hypothetical protein
MAGYIKLAAMRSLQTYVIFTMEPPAIRLRPLREYAQPEPLWFHAVGRDSQLADKQLVILFVLRLMAVGVRGPVGQMRQDIRMAAAELALLLAAREHKHKPEPALILLPIRVELLVRVMLLKAKDAIRNPALYLLPDMFI